MPDTQMTSLSDRGLLQIRGPDAEELLQNTVTGDMDRLKDAPAIYTGLLSPQGKILFDFFITSDGEDDAQQGYFIDVAKSECSKLLMRLNMYKLRSNAEISDISETHHVAAAWSSNNGSDTGTINDTNVVKAFPDPRLDDLGLRAIIKNHNSEPNPETEALYHAHRIGLGVPEGGKDFAFGDAFPHEALFDQLDAVSFKKGCYVGQEVVSRMHHRGTARKRIVSVTSDKPLPDGNQEVRAGQALLGTLGSVANTRGLALLRLDRVSEALANNEEITVGQQRINVETQRWASFSLNDVSGRSPETPAT